MNDNEIRLIKERLHADLNHAAELLIGEPNFDNLADAAETLVRAANRVAPIGHSVRLIRDSLDIVETERMGATRGWY